MLIEISYQCNWNGTGMTIEWNEIGLDWIRIEFDQNGLDWNRNINELDWNFHGIGSESEWRTTIPIQFHSISISIPT